MQSIRAASISLTMSAAFTCSSEQLAMTSTVKSSLRKACRICTKRKRRCIVELPKCQRCRQRNLKCIYDLEPLVTSRGPVQWRSTTHTWVEASKQSDAFLEYISSLHMSNKIHACLVNRSLVSSFAAVPLTQDPDAVEYIIEKMLHFPGRAHHGETTPFTHPRLHGQSFCTPLDFRVQAGTSGSQTPGNLILDVVVMTLEELLAATQELILFLIQHAFKEKGMTSRPIETGFYVLTQWRTLLWSRGFRATSSNLSAWQSWILGESVRRTILMSYLVEGTYSAWHRGWCIHRLFVYALPFSTQGKLWLANTENEWSTMAGMDMGGTDAAVRELVSFEEFTRTFARTPFQPGDDLFQRLLLVSHHGRGLVEEQLNQIGKEMKNAKTPAI